MIFDWCQVDVNDCLCKVVSSEKSLHFLDKIVLAGNKYKNTTRAFNTNGWSDQNEIV